MFAIVESYLNPENPGMDRPEYSCLVHATTFEHALKVFGVFGEEKSISGGLESEHYTYLWFYFKGECPECHRKFKE